MTVIPHPTYSSDLMPCDLFHFPELKMRLKERRLNATMIQAKLQGALF
jgi:hypothetical protein